MSLSDEHRQWLTLKLAPGVGTAQFIRLLARFRTPANILSAPVRDLAEVVGKSLAERIAQYKDVADTEGQERLMKQCGAWLITLGDDNYPARLAEIYDPPLLLFARGSLIEEDQRAVAIVGTRRASPYGLRMAEKFGGELARRGVTVVSGMANGVDAAAHRGALNVGGRTIAILGNGVDVLYPKQHAELRDAIIASGCLLSQFPMGVGPSPGHFPYRNRIISGFTAGVLVVEAPSRSGALITARQAAEQGREVFAVPGQVGSKNSEGPHALIREGAKLVESVDDILMELELPEFEDAPASAAAPAQPREAAPAAQDPHPSAPEASERGWPRARDAQHDAERQSPAAAAQAPVTTDNPKERQVLNVLDPNGSYVDEIAAACRLSVSDALSTLTLLEIKGLVRQFSGKRFAPR